MASLFAGTVSQGLLVNRLKMPPTLPPDVPVNDLECLAWHRHVCVAMALPRLRGFDGQVAEQRLHADAEALVIAVDVGPVCGLAAHAEAAYSGEDRHDEVIREAKDGTWSLCPNPARVIRFQQNSNIGRHVVSGSSGQGSDLRGTSVKHQRRDS